MQTKTAKSIENTKSTNNKISWFKLNRSLHRDIGYFCIGMTLIFSISGIAVNHIDDWNPNYQVSQSTVVIQDLKQHIDSPQLDHYLVKELGLSSDIRADFWESGTRYKLFLENDTNIFVDFETQQVTVETIRSRPILKIFNQLHLNEIKNGWVYFSDLFAVMLIFLSISALFMIRGRNGVLGKRGLIVLAGFICPFLFILA